jgi:hypothetical protein
MASRLTLTALGATLALGLISPATAANLITNGGFEDQVGFTGSGYDYANDPTGWTTNAAWDASAYNAVKGGAYGLAHDGDDSVRFGSSANAGPATAGIPTTLSQTFSDVVGGQYTVTFYAYNGLYAGASGSRPQNYLTASAGGQSITLADTVGGNPALAGCDASCYALGTFTFIGTGSDTLSIAAVADFNYWHLDDVSVTGGLVPGGVPEPASWAMMVGGFGLMGAAMRRRRRDMAALA